jgi:hypothetical protein
MSHSHGSGHAIHAAHKVTELALSTPQGQAAIAAATGFAIVSAPVVVPLAVTAAVTYGIYQGFRKLSELLDS